MIDVRGLTKRYGARLALDNVTFTARDGSITALLGPNGAGKTTTFRIASGLLRADGGAIEIGGRVEHDAAILGVLPHVHGLYGRLTVREHIRYFGELRGLGGHQLEARIAQLIAELGLTGRADAFARTLSQGERVKVAVAGAMVHAPRHLILDEPTSGLDVMSTRALHAVLRSLRDSGACVLFSSHVLPEVAALCDHVVMMAAGRVAAAGAPADLLARHHASSLEELFVSLSVAPTRVGVS
jgi:sodium transport system ATP-binding protein